MLEQYRKDFPAEDKDRDLLPDSESSMGKRKLLFILSGAAFALLFFLFLMGIFRSDEDQLVQHDAKPDIIKESIVSLEEKLQVVLARLEKLEQERASPQLAKSTPNNVQESVNTAATSSPNITLSTPQDAIAMTDQAIRGFIEKNTAPQVAAIPEKVAPKKEVQSQVAKAKDKKSKDKKAKDKSSQVASSPNSYIIQRGDTLSKISVRCYGTPHRWRAIYEANRDRINNINQLKVGTTLVIPQDKKG